ncbi:hypothetical protein SLE2022_077250 [Rubroshorea leprosula]
MLNLLGLFFSLMTESSLQESSMMLHHRTTKLVEEGNKVISYIFVFVTSDEFPKLTSSSSDEIVFEISTSGRDDTQMLGDGLNSLFWGSRVFVTSCEVDSGNRTIS